VTRRCPKAAAADTNHPYEKRLPCWLGQRPHKAKAQGQGPQPGHPCKKAAGAQPTDPPKASNQNGQAPPRRPPKPAKTPLAHDGPPRASAVRHHQGPPRVLMRPGPAARRMPEQRRDLAVCSWAGCQRQPAVVNSLRGWFESPALARHTRRPLTAGSPRQQRESPASPTTRGHDPARQQRPKPPARTANTGPGQHSGHPWPEPCLIASTHPTEPGSDLRAPPLEAVTAPTQGGGPPI